ncbi:MAG: deoxycytidylate deaminase, partial [Flavobacteriaceae bacterium]
MMLSNTIVKDFTIKKVFYISDGYNGTPSGFENICEDEDYYTKWYVLHAEANAILKVASSTQSCKGATLYITLSPCKECSKLIHQSGIRRVVFAKAYRDQSGVTFLEKAGVEVEHIMLENKE